MVGRGRDCGNSRTGVVATQLRRPVEAESLLGEPRISSKRLRNVAPDQARRRKSMRSVRRRDHLRRHNRQLLALDQNRLFVCLSHGSLPRGKMATPQIGQLCAALSMRPARLAEAVAFCCANATGAAKQVAVLAFDSLKPCSLRRTASSSYVRSARLSSIFRCRAAPEPAGLRIGTPHAKLEFDSNSGKPLPFR